MTRGKPSRKRPAEKKPALTHFLCLPLVTAASKPQLETSLEAFRDDVSPTGGADGSSAHDTGPTTYETVHPKAIRPVGALHCTLGVMSLSKDQLDQAVETLRAIDVERLLSASATAYKSGTDDLSTPAKDQDEPASLTRPISPPSNGHVAQPLRIDLKGVVSMHDPQKTSILYTAPADSSGRLYPFCLALQDLFKQRGLLVPDDRKLKLHATIVNTIYAKGRRKRAPPQRQRQQTPDRSQTNALAQDANAGEAQSGDIEQDSRSQGHGPNANAPLKIDARAILEKYQDFFWANDVVLDRIAICEMGAKKKFAEDGKLVAEEYTEVASVKLPI